MPAAKKPATAPPEPLKFATRRAFETWLRRHHADCDGTWLLLTKVGASERGLTYAEAVEVSLCHGWVDGQRKPHDETCWLQRFTPRRPRSLWSKINRAKAEALIESGRMQPAGLAEIARAKADGRWECAYDGARASTVPADLETALAAHPGAREFFATLDGANRYAVLWRVQTAKLPATRARRIETLVAMLGRGERIHSKG